jgi:hypothetical protein
MNVLLAFLPALAQSFIPEMSDLSGFSSQNVLGLESVWSGNQIPTNTWEGVAGAVGFGAACSDIVAQEIFLGLKGGVSGGAAVAMVTAFVCDWVVIEVSIANWAVHSANLVLVAVIFAGIGWIVTLYALREKYADLAGYDKWALVLSSIGLAAAAADYSIYTA